MFRPSRRTVDRVWGPAPLAGDHPLNRGRVGCWLPLAANSGGGTLYNLAGPVNGTLQGGLAWNSAETGPCLTGFAGGSTTFVDCTTNAAFNPTAGLTLSAWVRTTLATFDTNGTWAIARDDNALGRSFALGFNGTGTSNIALQINGAATITAGNWTTFGPGLTSLDNTWVHLIAAGDPANGWRLWCNSSSVGTAAWVAPNATTGKTTLGQRTYAGFEGGLTGRLRSASLWNRGLSDAEAMAEFRISAAGYPGVLNRYRGAVSAPAAPTRHFLALLGVGS